MPKLVHALPKYRKHKASGQAVVTLSGRDHYLGPHGTKASRILYDRLVAEWMVQGRRPAVAYEESIAVVVLCDRYLKHAEAYYRKNGESTGVVAGVKCAIKYLRTWYGREPAAEFGPLALKTLLQKMVDDRLSRTYINDHLARIKRIWKWGVGEQLIPPATYQAIAVVGGLVRGRTEAREPKPIMPVDDATVDATLPHLHDVAADMVRLQRLTGMRPAEVCILRPCDLDRSGDVWLYRPGAHKTEHHGRERIVFIGGEAQAVLLRYLARAPEDYCFRPVDSEAKRRAAAHKARVVPINHGNRPGTNRKRKARRAPGDRYTTASYRRAITRACGKAKVEAWAPNRLRHSFATKVRRDFGLEAAQVALGHSSAQVTQVYAERDIAKGIQVARSIG